MVAGLLVSPGQVRRVRIRSHVHQEACPRPRFLVLPGDADTQTTRRANALLPSGVVLFGERKTRVWHKQVTLSPAMNAGVKGTANPTPPVFEHQTS